MPLAEALKQKKEIKKLKIDFQNNMSQQQDMNQFFSVLKDLNKITEIRINIDKSQNCQLSDENGLSCRWLLKAIQNQLEVFEFSVLQTECRSEFWMNLLSGLRNIKQLKTFSLSANFFSIRKDSTLKKSLINTFSMLSDIQCLNISSDYLNLILKSISQNQFNYLKHTKLCLQQYHLSQQSQQPIIKQSNSENILLFFDFLVQNYSSLTDFKFTDDQQCNQLFHQIKQECLKTSLQIQVYNKYFCSKIPINYRLVIWDMYF